MFPANDSRRAPRAKAPWAARACTAGIALALVAAAGATPPGAPAPAHPATPAVAHTAAECADLVKQYDVAAPAHQGSAHAGEAARERSSGDAACHAGHYADGVAALRRALHYIGVSPVRISPSPHS